MNRDEVQFRITYYMMKFYSQGYSHLTNINFDSASEAAV